MKASVEELKGKTKEVTSFSQRISTLLKEMNSIVSSLVGSDSKTVEPKKVSQTDNRKVQPSKENAKY